MAMDGREYKLHRVSVEYGCISAPGMPMIDGKNEIVRALEVGQDHGALSKGGFALIVNTEYGYHVDGPTVCERYQDIDEAIEVFQAEMQLI